MLTRALLAMAVRMDIVLPLTAPTPVLAVTNKKSSISA